MQKVTLHWHILSDQHAIIDKVLELFKITAQNITGGIQQELKTLT